jgi:hypothetical protein
VSSSQSRCGRVRRWQQSPWKCRYTGEKRASRRFAPLRRCRGRAKSLPDRFDVGARIGAPVGVKGKVDGTKLDAADHGEIPLATDGHHQIDLDLAAGKPGALTFAADNRELLRSRVSRSAFACCAVAGLSWSSPPPSYRPAEMSSRSVQQRSRLKAGASAVPVMLEQRCAVVVCLRAGCGKMDDGGGSHTKHDLADMDARFHPRVSFGGFLERKDCVDDGAHLAGGDQRPDVAFHSLSDGCFVGDRT